MPNDIINAQFGGTYLNVLSGTQTTFYGPVTGHLTSGNSMPFYSGGVAYCLSAYDNTQWNGAAGSWTRLPVAWRVERDTCPATGFFTGTLSAGVYVTGANIIIRRTGTYEVMLSTQVSNSQAFLGLGFYNQSVTTQGQMSNSSILLINRVTNITSVVGQAMVGGTLTCKLTGGDELYPVYYAGTGSLPFGSTTAGQYTSLAFNYLGGT